MESAMATEILEKGNWHSYFDGMSKVLSGKEAQLEVNAIDIGAQVEAEFTPLLGIVYDTRSEILEVLLEGLDHTIANVREIIVDHDGFNLNSVCITDTDGVQQIIRLRDAAMLPSPSALGSESRP
jgi:hypothetical protein